MARDKSDAAQQVLDLGDPMQLSLALEDAKLRSRTQPVDETARRRELLDQAMKGWVVARRILGKTLH